MNPAYLNTVFDLDGDPQLPQAFVIITAYNPQGRSAPSSRNAHQDQTLRAVLSGRGAEPIRVIGRSEDGAHQEPSWIATLNLNEGIEVGRMFKQVAIYQVIGDELSLHSCDPRRSDPGRSLRSWRARLR